MDPPRSERQPAALALAAVVRRVRALPMFVVLSFTGVLVVIGLVGRLAFEFAQGMRDPHRHMFGQDGVRPLLGKDRVFDVGVSIFALRPFNETARPECSAEAESDWYERFFDRVYGRHRERPGEDATDSDEDMTDSDRLYHATARESFNRGNAWNLPPTPCAMRYVPETAELWSGVVARNLTIANRTAEATIDLDVPTEFLWVASVKGCSLTPENLCGTNPMIQSGGIDPGGRYPSRTCTLS